MLKTFAIVLGLATALSACVGPYGYDGYGDTRYGYTRPADYGYGYNTPGYYGAGYNFDTPYTSPHGTVQ